MILLSISYKVCVIYAVMSLTIAIAILTYVTTSIELESDTTLMHTYLMRFEVFTPFNENNFHVD